MDSIKVDEYTALHSHGGCCLLVAPAWWICLQVAQNYLKQDQLFHTILHLPVVLTAVSSAVQDILQQEFGRSSLLIPNGIDCDRFQPGPYQLLDGSGSTAEDSSNQALGTAAAVMAGQVTVAALNQAGASAAEDCSGSGQAMAEAPLGPGDGVLSIDSPAGADAGAERSADVAAASSLELLAAAAAAAAEDASEAAPMELIELPLAAAAGPADTSAQDPQAAASDANDHQHPCVLASLNLAGRLPAVHKKRVLLVGNPALPLKGFPTAIAALTAVSAVLPVKIRWVCQVSSINAWQGPCNMQSNSIPRFCYQPPREVTQHGVSIVCTVHPSTAQVSTSCFGVAGRAAVYLACRRRLCWPACVVCLCGSPEGLVISPCVCPVLLCLPSGCAHGSYDPWTTGRRIGP